MKLLIPLGFVVSLASCGQPTMERLSFVCDTDYECSQLPNCLNKIGCDGSPKSEPYRLVGYDCEGASEPLYRDEEDEFPKCKEIVGTYY